MAEFVVGFGELQFEMQRAGEMRKMFVTIGYRNTVAATPANLNSIMTAMDSRFGTVCSTQYSILRVLSRYQATAAAVTLTSSTQVLTTFAGGTDDELISTAVVIRKTTSVAGRKNRGRFYMPGALHGNIEAGGQLTPTAHINWITACIGFHADFMATFQEPVINHADLSTPTSVLTFEPQRRLGSQRRRLEQGVLGTP